MSESRYVDVLEGVLRKYRLRPRGLILAGGNFALRLERLLGLGFERVLIIEEDAGLLPLVAASVLGAPKVSLVHAAVSNVAGMVVRRESGGAERVIHAAGLDQILEANGWGFDSCNVLVVRGNGFQNKVLEGGAKMVPHLDLAVFESIQAGGADGGIVRGVLEEPCEAGGLVCAGVERDATPEHCWVSYVRRPVVTMATLGRNGRFANQLFQYLFLRLVAESQNAVLQTPAWQGEALFHCQSVRLLRPPQRLSMESNNEAVPGALPVGNPVEFIGRRDPDFRSTDFWGYFQLHTSALRSFRGLIRSVFCWTEAYREAQRCLFGRLRAGGKRVVAVHLRRGDYGYDAFFRAPCSWYERWLESEGLEACDHLVFVCSEDAARYASRFAGYEVATSERFALELGLEPWLVEFMVMCGSDALAISNSTFSFFASLLNETARCFVRPVWEQGGLVAFDPWDAQPLLGKKLTPEEHLELAQQD